MSPGASRCTNCGVTLRPLQGSPDATELELRGDASCPDCGEEVSSFDKACAFCGARLNFRENTPPPESVEEPVAVRGGGGRLWRSLAKGFVIGVVLVAGVLGIIAVRTDRSFGYGRPARPLNEFYAVIIPPSGRACKTLALSPVYANRITVQTDGPPGDICLVPYRPHRRGLVEGRAWEDEIDVDTEISAGRGVRSAGHFSRTLVRPPEGILWAVVVRVPPNADARPGIVYINLAYE